MFKTYNWADLRRVVDYIYNGKPMRLVPYHFPFTIPVIADNAFSESTLNILSNADFLALALLQSTVTSVTGAKMNIIDSASNERWFDSNVPVQSLMNASNGDVHCFDFPRWVAANSTLTLQFEGLVAAVASAVPCSIQGVLAMPY